MSFISISLQLLIKRNFSSDIAMFAFNACGCVDVVHNFTAFALNEFMCVHETYFATNIFE